MATKKKNRTPVSLSDISKVMDEYGKGTPDELRKMLQGLATWGVDEIKVYLEKIKEVYKTEKERYEVFIKLQKETKVHVRDNEVLLGLINKELKQAEEKVKQQQISSALYKDVIKSLNVIIAKNKEIFKISHDMQLQGNITWSQYTQLYNQAYDTARKMNAEMNKQLFTAGELIKAQEAMITHGWRNIDTAALTNLSSQASLITRTLGAFPVELQTAFQMSYRQFGNMTDRMVHDIGNQLNTFSDTFGMTVQTLTQTVSNMMAANTFLARNNMNAQVAANQSLMAATSLATQVGIISPSFITQLAKVAQFGTASQMVGLYQAGAYLQDFSTADFQDMMISQDYEAATESLLGSIHKTLSGMEAGYLRNEYMARIGEGFGLTQDDLLQIMTNGNKLSEYSADIQEKLLRVNNSMEDEIRDLKMTIEQQVENWWANTKMSEGIGSIMQELGLYDLNKLIHASNTLLLLNLKGAGGQTLSQSLLGLGKRGAAGGAGGLGLGGRMLGTGAGVATGVGLNILGHSLASNPEKSAVGGGFASIGGGALGGALTGLMLGGGFTPVGIAGAVIGGLAGAGAGIANHISAMDERKSKVQEIEDKKILAARERAQITTGNPVVDAINNMNDNLTYVITGEGEQNRRVEFLIDSKNTMKID